MKQFAQHVLVRNNWMSGMFATEPIEAAWADSALFFIEVGDKSEKFQTLNASVQISPNGITWVDEGTSFENVTETGLYFKRVSHFGGWLRLKCGLSGEDPSARLMIHLILKE